MSARPYEPLTPSASGETAAASPECRKDGHKPEGQVATNDSTNVYAPESPEIEALREPVCEPASKSATPFQQLPPAERDKSAVDPALFSAAAAAVAAIRGHGRRQNGQVTTGNTVAIRHGLYSSQLLNAPDVAAWHAEQVSAITADLGGEVELSSLARASVREVARLEVILAALGEDLLRTGVLTGKGKSRSATTVYLHVLDRFTRLSQALGLARKPKSLGTLADVHRAVDEANR
jgi:hypothetical protein